MASKAKSMNVYACGSNYEHMKDKVRKNESVFQSRAITEGIKPDKVSKHEMMRV